MALVFDKALDAVPGRVDQIAPSIRRVLAPNPGAFTYLGTGTYIVGSGTVAIIDPGPDNVAHLEALARALEGETVSHIVCTHTHPDHSPGSRRLKAMVGGAIVGCAPHPVDLAVEAALAAQLRATALDDQPTADQSESDQSEAEHAEERSDADHVPEWLMVDGDTIDGPGWTLEAVATPGHISNHLCFAFSQADVLFSGDHVMAWSTSVVSPPAGDLNDYLRSLEKVLARAESTYWPTHGPAVRDPHTYVTQLHGHRLHRTAQVLEQLSSGEKTIAAFVAAMYPGLDERLIKAAGRSVLAHLVALRQEGRVLSTNDADDATTQYSLGF
jgi:glyoxylase-like metal-dependent hydrolase (beta-lactamase superfamily II)